MTLLTIEEVRERVPVSRPTIYALMKRAGFPRPTKVPGKGPRAYWNADELATWLAANPHAGAGQ